MSTQRDEDIDKLVNEAAKIISSNYEVITQYTYEDYNEMKKDLGWFNRDIAEIVGFEHMSVKNQTQPKYDLPFWAQVLVHLWKQENEGKLGDVDSDNKVVESLNKYKEAYRDAREEIKELSKKVSHLEKEVRKAERKEKQRIKYIEKLDELETESEITISKEEITSTAVKNQLGKIANKRRRKLGVLARLKSTIETSNIPDTPSPSTPTKKTKAGATKKQ